MNAIDTVTARLNRLVRCIAAGCLLALCACVHVFAGETLTFFHNDNAGSPMLATDINGNPVWKETYRPYGDRLIEAATSNNNALWFTGKAYDEQTGLSYLGARYYDPTIGRFMGIDPAPLDVENLQTINRYAYANNNPYRFVDPDGHSPVDVVFLAYDLGKLGVALWTGTGVAAAALDVAWSTVGVLSPVPGMGQVIKSARAADRVVDAVGAARTADHMADAVDTASTAERLADGAGAARGVRGTGDDVIYRLGNQRESASRLGRKSAEAEETLGVHGVSGSTTRPPAGTPCSSASCSALENAGFPVHRTPSRRDPSHVTIELPNPVTKEVADAFNEVFGR